MTLRNLGRIVAGEFALAGLVLASDGIEVVKTISEDAGFWKTLMYADGAAMIAGGLTLAAYTSYHLVKDLYQQYKEETNPSN